MQSRKPPKTTAASRKRVQREGEWGSGSSKCHMMDGYLLMDLKIIKLASARPFAMLSFEYLSYTHS